MITQSNFKFKQLLDESGLNVQEKYDLSNIFNCLSDGRKIEIIDNWSIYLNKVLKIRNETLEKRRDNIRNALNNINNIVNEAILRQKDEEVRRNIEIQQNREIEKNAQVYDQMRKNQNLQNLLNKQNNDD